MTPKVISIVLANTYTVNDLMRRFALLRNYLEAKLFGGREGGSITLETLLMRERADEGAVVALKAWNEAFSFEKISLESLHAMLPSVEEDIRGLPILRLYTPVELDVTQTNRVGNWVRTHLDPNLMLELHVDARAVGGCAFVWRDTFRDYSLRHFVHMRREKVVAMFDKYGSMGNTGRGA